MILVHAIHSESGEAALGANEVEAHPSDTERLLNYAVVGQHAAHADVIVVGAEHERDAGSHGEMIELGGLGGGESQFAGEQSGMPDSGATGRFDPTVATCLSGDGGVRSGDATGDVGRQAGLALFSAGGVGAGGGGVGADALLETMKN